MLIHIYNESNRQVLGGSHAKCRHRLKGREGSLLSTYHLPRAVLALRTIYKASVLWTVPGVLVDPADSPQSLAQQITEKDRRECWGGGQDDEVGMNKETPVLGLQGGEVLRRRGSKPKVD